MQAEHEERTVRPVGKAANPVILKLSELVSSGDKYKFGKTWYAGLGDPNLTVEAGVAFVIDELKTFLKRHKELSAKD